MGDVGRDGTGRATGADGGRAGEADDELLMAIYGAVVSDRQLAGMLQGMADRFGCISALLFYKDADRPRSDIAVACGIWADPDVQRRYQLQFAELDPAPDALGRLQIGRAGSTDQLIDVTSPRHRTFLHDFYYPLGLGGALAAPLIKQQGRVGMIAVQRALDRRPFDEDDCRQLERLVPHLVHMVGLRQRFYALEEAVRSAEHALRSSCAGIMTFDGGGVLRHANPRSRTILERHDGLSLDRAGRLVLGDARMSRRLKAFTADERDEDAIIIRQPRAGSAACYVLRVRRHAPTTSDSGSSGGLSVHVFDPSGTGAPDVDVLSEALGLTASSGRLVTAMLEGADLAAYASKAGIARSTAKFHLRSAFHSTGTRRQSDLVRLAGAVTRDLGLSRP